MARHCPPVMDSYSDYEYENVLDDADDDENSSGIPRTRSSLGLSLLTYASSRPSQVSFGSSSRSSAFASGRAADDVCVFMPPHRPLVGGGAAAAFEAARHDFYLSRHAERVRERDDEDNTVLDHFVEGPQQVRDERQVIEDPDVGDEDRSVGSSCATNTPIQFVEATPRRDGQYDMLRLYHMNLLQRMEETSFILNLVHQQQRQEQGEPEILSALQPRIIDSPLAAITPIRFLSIPTPEGPDGGSTRSSGQLDNRSRAIEDDDDEEDEDAVNVESSSKRQRRY